jgi:hypothetical protein
MAGTAIMTLRVDPALLAALKERAAREGRSVSAEVIRMIERNVEPPRAKGAKRTSTMGMFADFDAPTLDDFKRLRRRFSTLVSPARRGRRSG